MAAVGHDESPTPPGYFAQLHLEYLAVLIVLCVALSIIGWSWRPPAGGFPHIPGTLAIGVYARTPGITESLRPAGKLGGSSMSIVANDIRDEEGETARWDVVVDNLGHGRVCTPSAYAYRGAGAAYAFTIPRARVFVPRYESTSGAYALEEISGRGPLYVKLCWASGGPLAVNGPYLSALLPPALFGASLTTPAPEVQNVIRVLALEPGDDTANYTVTSPFPPSSTAPGYWVWSGAVSFDNGIRIAATDTSTTQSESYRTFVSGIVFGIAGGAFVALLQELLMPFSRRRDRRFWRHHLGR